MADQLNGKTIAYYESTPSIKGIGESFIDSMSKLGIEIEAQKVTYQEAVSLQFGAHDDYDMIVGSWGSDFPDPSGNLRPNFASENIVAGGANASAYTNPAGRCAADAAELARGQDRASQAAHPGPGAHRRGLAGHLGHQPRLAAGGQQAGPGRVDIGALWYWGSLFKDLWVTQ